MRVVETPRSSNVKQVTFDAGVLTIEFRTGGIYRYENVPDAVFKEVETGKDKISVGRWFLSKIKGKYLGKRIK